MTGAPGADCFGRSRTCAGVAPTAREVLPRLDHEQRLCTLESPARPARPTSLHVLAVCRHRKLSGHVAVTAAYHLDKRHWNTIQLNGTVPGDQPKDWIEDSFALVVAGLSRAQRASLFEAHPSELSSPTAPQRRG